MRFQTPRIGLVFLFLLWFNSPLYAETAPALNISGSVNNPASISIKNLENFQTLDVQLNEITSNQEYHGTFIYHGVSLKTLLTLADIEKKDTDFNKPVDLAVMVKNQAGESVALSWGEIFFKNPGNVVIATSADPVLPHKGIDHFKDKQAYHKMMEILNRKIGFPKLVIPSDFHTDRCLEQVTDIIIQDLRPHVPGEKSPTPHSETFSISGPGIHPETFAQLPEHTPVEISCHIVGEGRGYHGTHAFGGMALKELIRAPKPEMNLNTVFLISAPDAYRALVSYGELFLSPYGNRILVADHSNGKKIKEDGKFILVLPDDLMADRMVKAVCKIEAIPLEK
jgi:hypothetical protein